MHEQVRKAASGRLFLWGEKIGKAVRRKGLFVIRERAVMNIVWRLLTTAIGWLLVGLVVAGLGGYWFWHGSHDKLPARGELTAVTGQVQTVTKVTRKKYGVERSAKYEFALTTADNKAMTVTIPGSKITEDRAASVSGQRVAIMLRDGDVDDVWELRSGNTILIDYAASHRDRTESLVWETETGPYAAVAGLLLLLAGSFRLYRNRASA
jgi:hypothetical protein